MDQFTAKALVFALSVITRLFFGFMPLFVSKKLLTNKATADSLTSKTLDYLVSLSLHFGGGVLLATCFIHLIPEVRESLTTELPENFHHYPVTETIICLGFFLVYFVEETVHHFVLKHKKQSKAEPKSKSSEDIISVNSNQGTESADNEMSLVYNLRSLFIVLALSFHSVLEGLAVGSEEDIEKMGFLFLAVSIHECTILFCIGIKLVTSYSSLRTIILNIIVLALVSPFGILLGSLLTINVSEVNQNYQTIVNATLQGLAAGTILYVTFFEVLNEERKKDTASGLCKFLFTVIGFMFMVILEMFGGHNHNHTHIHEHGHGHEHGHEHGHDCST